MGSERVPGGGAAAGRTGRRQVRRGGVDEACLGEEGTGGRRVPAGRRAAREGRGVEGRSQEKEGGSKLGLRDEPPVGPAPVTWAPDLAAVAQSAGWSVSWSVGQWPAARFPALMFGGGRDTGASRAPEPPGEEPRTQVSGLSPRPRSPARSGPGAPAGALPGEPKAPRFKNHPRSGGQCQQGPQSVSQAQGQGPSSSSLARRLGEGYNSRGICAEFPPNPARDLRTIRAPLQVPAWPWRCAGGPVTSVLCGMSPKHPRSLESPRWSGGLGSV